jgi:pyruvyltransferase
MNTSRARFGVILFFLLTILHSLHAELPLYYWQQKEFVNFGDYLSVKIVERMIDGPVTIYKKTKVPKKKFIALGSMLYFANTNDVLWGTGSNHKQQKREDYHFTDLDIRAVRGPLTKAFIEENFGIRCPNVYGDPALLFPYLFPELTRKVPPRHSYIVIPHLYERNLFPEEEHIVLPTEPWDQVIQKILDSELVISGSLHGIIVAEAYGIPARYLRLSEKEPLFKYRDYYLSTGRSDCKFATSLEEALEMGGEEPIQFDPEPLYDAFPFEFWPNAQIKRPYFRRAEGM